MSHDKYENEPRKTCVVFFVIDTSDAMSGEKIRVVNSAIKEMIEQFKIINSDNLCAEIGVAILAFSSGARWLTPNGPMKPENYSWSDLDAGGKRDIGEAFRMLEEKLHRSSGFMQRANSSCKPIIFLMTDGEPTDVYKTHLARLQNNWWFKASNKVALAIGDEVNNHVLMEFTGSNEAVVRPGNAGEKLARMIKFIAVTDEQVCTDYGNDEDTNLSQIQSDLNVCLSSGDGRDDGTRNDAFD